MSEKNEDDVFEKKGELEEPPKNDEEKEHENYWLTLVNFEHQPFWHLSFKGTGYPGVVFKVFCGDIARVRGHKIVHEKRMKDRYMCRECSEKYKEARGLAYNVCIPPIPSEEKLVNNIFDFRHKKDEEDEKAVK